CLLSPSEREKHFVHSLHSYGRSPVCDRKWRRSTLASVKALSQRSHLCVLSRLSYVGSWVFSCELQLLSWAKRFPQTEQVNGFSPVCTRSCRTRWLCLLK
ncbi:hypothetical protein NL108_005097, partial [Boleophthalmus pectinirostris]